MNLCGEQREGRRGAYRFFVATVFQRRIEDFTCGHCGAKVEGNGYTNHCPKCLWSKHVDENPGDRAARCGGMMEPTGVEVRAGGEERVAHRCLTCGYRFATRVLESDDREALVRLSQRQLE